MRQIIDKNNSAPTVQRGTPFPTGMHSSIHIPTGAGGGGKRSLERQPYPILSISMLIVIIYYKIISLFYYKLICY